MPAVTKFEGHREALSEFAKTAFVSDQACMICNNKAGLKTQTAAG
jgi:hypothetical protein